MACVVMTYKVMAVSLFGCWSNCIWCLCTDTRRETCIVMAYIVVAYIVIAYIVMALYSYIVMAYVGILCSRRRVGSRTYDLYSYGLI